MLRHSHERTFLPEQQRALAAELSRLSYDLSQSDAILPDGLVALNRVLGEAKPADEQFGLRAVALLRLAGWKEALATSCESTGFTRWERWFDKQLRIGLDYIGEQAAVSLPTTV